MDPTPVEMCCTPKRTIRVSTMFMGFYLNLIVNWSVLARVFHFSQIINDLNCTSIFPNFKSVIFVPKTKST